jgi:hypothetical protein
MPRIRGRFTSSLGRAAAARLDRRRKIAIRFIKWKSPPLVDGSRANLRARPLGYRMKFPLDSHSLVVWICRHKKGLDGRAVRPAESPISAPASGTLLAGPPFGTCVVSSSGICCGQTRENSFTEGRMRRMRPGSCLQTRGDPVLLVHAWRPARLRRRPHIAGRPARKRLAYPLAPRRLWLPTAPYPLRNPVLLLCGHACR